MSTHQRGNPSEFKFAPDSVQQEISEQEFIKTKEDEQAGTEDFRRGDSTKQGKYVSDHSTYIGRNAELLKRANRSYLQSIYNMVPSLAFQSGEVFNKFLEKERTHGQTGDIVDPVG